MNDNTIEWEFEDEEDYEMMTFRGIKQIIKWIEKNDIKKLDHLPVSITGFKYQSDLTVIENQIRLRIDVDHSDIKEQWKWKRLQKDCISITKYQAEVDLT